MKKVNFNNLDDIQIPEAWTKNALSLPQTLEDKRKVVFFGKFSKNLALVASLVLVCALSVFLFIFTQKGNILSTHEPEQTSESTALTQTEQDKQNESKIKPTTQKETEEESFAATEPTEITTEETVDETKKPTTPSSTAKPTTSGNKETTSADDSSSTKPNGSPSGSTSGESGTNKPNSGQTPTQKPNPTEPNDEAPDTPEVEASTSFITEYIPKDKLLNSNKVYCALRYSQSDGYESFGDIYTANIVWQNDTKACVTFKPTESQAPMAGMYDYVFYNVNFEVVASGSVFIAFY